MKGAVWVLKVDWALPLIQYEALGKVLASPNLIFPPLQIENNIANAQG